MKTIKVVALTVVLMMVFVTIGQSKENEIARKKAVNELNVELRELFEEMPFDELMTLGNESKLALCFKVDETGTVQFQHILGRNDKLVDYSKQILESNILSLEKSVFGNEYYWIKIRFEYRK